MGANAQTAVPVFTSGQVLTAAQQNQINTGIPVFATTVTRDAAFGGAGEKTLAEGQFAYIEATNSTQYYDGAAWQTVGASSGLTLISTTTIGTTVSSVAITGVFSSTYDNYRIIVSGGTASTATSISLKLGATTTGYYAGYPRVAFSGATDANLSDNNAASFTRFAAGNTNGLAANFDLLAPNLANLTIINGQSLTQTALSNGGMGSGYLDNTTAYTDFTLTTASGTITGGTIKVYGYANS